MKKLLGPDSRLVRYGTTLTSLIELNLLWLLCCLPVVTAGAATTAAYYTMYRILTGEDDAVLRPYFRAFRQNFKQATLLWLPLLVIAAVLGLDGAYLIMNFSGRFHVLWIAFAVILIIYLVVVTHAFAIMGRYDSPTRQIVRNCFLLTLTNFLRSLAVMLISIALPLVLIFSPTLVVKTLPLWGIVLFGLSFFIKAKLFLQSFEKNTARTNSGGNAEE